jgi:hypothetical protein
MAYIHDYEQGQIKAGPAGQLPGAPPYKGR